MKFLQLAQLVATIGLSVGASIAQNGSESGTPPAHAGPGGNETGPLAVQGGNENLPPASIGGPGGLYYEIMGFGPGELPPPYTIQVGGSEEIGPPHMAQGGSEGSGVPSWWDYDYGGLDLTEPDSNGRRVGTLPAIAIIDRHGVILAVPIDDDYPAWEKARQHFPGTGITLVAVIYYVEGETGTRRVYETGDGVVRSLSPIDFLFTPGAPRVPGTRVTVDQKSGRFIVFGNPNVGTPMYPK